MNRPLSIDISTLRWTLIFLLGLISLTLRANDEVAIPALNSPVMDTTGTLTSEQKASLANKLRNFETKKGTQIAILLVATTQPEPIESYALRVAEQWKIGRKGVDDGILLILAKQDRKARIEVGYGLEGVITDAISKRIIQDIMAPHLRQDDYAAGLNAAADSFMKLIEGEPLPAVETSSQESDGKNEMLFAVMAIVALISGAIGQRMHRMVGAVAAAGVAGALTWWFWGSVLFAVGLALVGFVIQLLGGLALLGSLQGGSWNGGGQGRRGGWGGGGGRFGGGGASGNW